MEQVEQRQRQQSADGHSENSELITDSSLLPVDGDLMPPGHRPVVQMPVVASGPSVPVQAIPLALSTPAFYPPQSQGYSGSYRSPAAAIPMAPPAQPQPFGPVADPSLQRLLASFANAPVNHPAVAALAQPLGQTFDVSAQTPVVYGGISGEGTGATHITVSYVTCHVGCSHVTSIVNGDSTSILSHASSPSNKMFMLIIAALSTYFLVM